MNAGRIVIFGMMIGFLTYCKSPDEEKLAISEKRVETQYPDADINKIDLSGLPFPYLSAYGFFEGNIASLSPQENVILYEPASSLFTDYALKSRFIWIPDGSSLRVKEGSEEGLMDFPDQTILIKNFYYPYDFRQPNQKRTIIETRLLVKEGGTWQAYPYVWNEAQTDAVYKVIGGEKEISWIDEEGVLKNVNYIIPNKNQCKSCHNIHEKLEPIGVKAMHLNHPLPNAKDLTSQLENWMNLGLLEKSSNIHKDWPHIVNAFDAKQSLENRARSYLDINCGHCHREEGPASTSGLFLTRMETEPSRLGVFKTPVAAGFGAGNLTFDIVPGEPDSSILLHRMKTSDVGAAMPEIGRAMPHKEGVELVREWIQGLTKP